MAGSSTTLELEEIQSIYTSELPIGLQKMREESALCDCVLACGDAEYPVHSVVMCVGSGYFRKTLADSGHIPPRIELPPTIEPAALQLILTYLYAGSIKSLKECADVLLPSVLKAAEFFQLHILHEYCWKVALSRLAVDTFAEIWCLADTCDDSRLMPTLVSFMADNLDKIIETGGFLILSLCQLYPFLQLLRLKHQPPDLIVRGILNWIRANVPTRERHLQDLFSIVNLRSLSNQYVKTLIKDDVIKTSSEVYNSLVAVAMDRLPTEPTHSLKNLRMISFTYDEWRPADVRQCNLDTQRWSRQVPFDLSLSCGTAAAYLNENVYFFGGGREAKEASGLISIYSTNQNTVIWTTVMIYCRFRPGAVALRNQLYVIGGANASGNIRCVECYDPVTDTCSEVASTVNRYFCPNVVAVENAIFVVGAWSCHSVERYNVATDSWSVVIAVPSLSNNIWPSATTCLGRIYLVKNAQERQIHIFNPLSEDWSVMPFGMAEGFAIQNIWNIVNGPLSRPFLFVLTRENELFLYNCLSKNMEKCFDIPRDFPVNQALTFFAVVP